MNGLLKTPYQYSQAELETAVGEAARVGKKVAVHATGEPGTGFAAKAGVWSIDHADQLSEPTMELMRQRGIPAVPTFAIAEYFAQHARSAEQKAALEQSLQLHATEKATQGGSTNGGGIGRGTVSARNASAGDGVDGEVRDESSDRFGGRLH